MWSCVVDNKRIEHNTLVELVDTLGSLSLKEGRINLFENEILSLVYESVSDSRYYIEYAY